MGNRKSLTSLIGNVLKYPKILEVIDCTGSGDVDTSTLVKADVDGSIHGTSGASLFVNPSWKNPKGEWHVGYKLVYELFSDTVTSRLKRLRKEKWEVENQEAIAEALKQLYEFDKKHKKVEDPELKKACEDLESRVDILRKHADSYDDKGPVIDAVVWHDGEVWRVALDTQSLEDEPGLGKLADFTPLTNYRKEREYVIFHKLSATCVVNVYNEGSVLSIVTDVSPHGTHVASIAAAFHAKEPLLNGVAPGAQLISCNIGDSRLGSSLTGTGLTRAIIAAVQHKCDLINMSYSGSSMLPDYGRFVDLVDEMVNKYRMVFVGCVGNDGPALSTVETPGGTSSSIIGIGAYMSPAVAAGIHCMVKAPTKGVQYHWSSCGPTTDGALGVSVCAPGAAVALVPAWTFQKRMNMFGTSMASPSACGGMALLISAMKAEGIRVSPYSIRKAIENTAAPAHGLPKNKLYTGHGLLQVDKAFEYIQKGRNLPCVWYQLKINIAGNSTPTYRGIYLREATACQKLTKWTVRVEPKVHEDASFLDTLNLPETIDLRSTEKAVVKAPEKICLINNCCTFNITVDPTSLGDGLHYYEVCGFSRTLNWIGALFRVPITITKPSILKHRPPLVRIGNLFQSECIERGYFEVPFGATWAEAIVLREMSVYIVQISPQRRPMKWTVVACSSVETFAFRVEGGSTLEVVAIAQNLSSGIGSHEPNTTDFEIHFHGISTNKEEVVLYGSEAPAQIDVEALLSSERLVPAAKLNKIRIPYHPIDAKFTVLSTKRDKLPSGKQIRALILTYKLKLEDSSEIKPYIPLLNNRSIENIFESQFYMISDSNKRVYAMGDTDPQFAKLPKGEFNLQLYLRHDNKEYLEKMQDLILFIERKLEEKEVVGLSFFSEPDGPVMGNGCFKSSILVPGMSESFYVGPPNKDKLPKNSVVGSVLVGEISYGKVSTVNNEEGNNPASYTLSYVFPPPECDEDKGKVISAACTNSILKRLEEEARDAKIKVLASLSQGSDVERAEWECSVDLLKSDYPKYTPLLTKILEGLLAQNNTEDKIHHYEEVIRAANEVIDSVDKKELAKYFFEISDSGSEEKLKENEANRDQLVEALYQKGLAMAEIESFKKADIQLDLFEENFKEFKNWADVKYSRYGTLDVIHERRSGRLGNALKVLNEILQDEAEPPKKQLYELKLALLKEIGWSHLELYEKQWMLVRFPPALPLF